MSVILIRPMNTSIVKGLSCMQYPINLGYLAARLKKEGIDVALIDFEVEAFDGASLLALIKEKNPILIGISCMTATILSGHSLAKFIKDAFGDIPIVVGGVHSTAIPERTLIEFPSFDIVVRGEGEDTLLELYHALANRFSLSSVKGLMYRDGSGSLVATGARALIEDLDCLPFPGRDLVNINLYRSTHVSRGFSRFEKNIAEIITARGCPYGCIFCASKVTFNQRVRYRSVANIISEMDECIKKYKVNHFSMLDDTFTFKKDVLYPVCDYLHSKKVSWDCCTRADRVNEEMIKKMIQSGCEKISFGMESGSERILKLIGKGVTVQQVTDAFSFCRKSGLRYVEATFMIGNHPSETMDDVGKTLGLIKRLSPDLMALSLTAPFPGTELNKIMKESGYLKKENWNEFVLYGGTPSWTYEHLDVQVLKDTQKKFMKQYYLSLPYMIRQLGKTKNLKELGYRFRMALNVLKGS
ncbi:MAG: radical SAM protein [Candidatus Omnitrophota bacterium]|nr:radical SAM protein [Candidatus Omnitrophota bacterium]